MTRYNDVVNPDETLEHFKREKKAKSKDFHSFFAPDAVMNALAVQELRAQLEEAEQLLREHGLVRVELVDEAEVCDCAREPSTKTEIPEAERCTEAAGRWRCSKRRVDGAVKCRLHGARATS